MKKMILLIIFILFLCSCNIHNYKMEFSDKIIFDEARDLYVPIPIKNNSVFIGFEVVDSKMLEIIRYKKNYGNNGLEVFEFENKIYPEISYDLLKNHTRKNKLQLKAVYESLSNDQLFAYELLENGNYGIKIKDQDRYPREITIPEVLGDYKITEVSPFGFYGITELVNVNIPKSIKYIGKFGIANTNIYNIDYKESANDTAFSNTLISGQGLKDYKFEFIEDKLIKKINIQDYTIEVDIDLNGGKIIENELDLVISRPILENEIFEFFENEEGFVVKIDDYELYEELNLKYYYRYGVGLKYKVISRKVTDDIFRYKYLVESDSYALYLLDEYLSLSKLILPSTYNGKKITEIRDFNNKFVSEIIIGEHVEAINGLFCTPNLKKITLSSSLKKVIPYAFSGTLLTNINLPNSLNSLDEGVFAYTFIKNFEISSAIEYIDGSSFARCSEIVYKSSNPLYIVSNDKLKVYYKDKSNLVLYSNSNDFEVINLKGVKVLNRGVFSYFNILEFNNYERLEYIDDFAFYNSYINKLLNLKTVDFIHEYAFFEARIKNIQI